MKLVIDKAIAEDNNLAELIPMRNEIGKHLLEFDLINMPADRSLGEGWNGRVYDPVLARFLSPDPFVQFPGTASGYNRYAYVMNNPLRFTDPSGYISEDKANSFLQSMMKASTVSECGFWYRGEYLRYDSFSGSFYGSRTGNNFGGAGAFKYGGAYYYNGVQISREHYTKITEGTFYPVGYRTQYTMKDGSIFYGTKKIRYWQLKYASAPVGNSIVPDFFRADWVADDSWNDRDVSAEEGRLHDATSLGIWIASTNISLSKDFIERRIKEELELLNKNNIGLDFTKEFSKVDRILRGARIVGGAVGVLSVGRDYYNTFIRAEPTMSEGEFYTNTAFTVIGYFGLTGATISGAYFAGELIIPGGWKALPYDSSYDIGIINNTSSDGIWMAPHLFGK